VVVDARDITRRYGEGATAVDALRGVSLEVEAGQLVAVMGPSGSGKSTLMHILAGLDKPTTGTVEIAGTEITTLSDGKLTRLRRQHIGFVFQFFNLLPMLTAEENVVLPLSIDRGGPEVVRKFFADIGVKNLAIHINPSNEAAFTLAVAGLPTTLLIDREGQELGRLVGPAEWDTPDMIGFLKSILSSRTGATTAPQ